MGAIAFVAADPHGEDLTIALHTLYHMLIAASESPCGGGPDLPAGYAFVMDRPLDDIVQDIVTPPVSPLELGR